VSAPWRVCAMTLRSGATLDQRCVLLLLSANWNVGSLALRIHVVLCPWVSNGAASRRARQRLNPPVHHAVKVLAPNAAAPTATATARVPEGACELAAGRGCWRSESRLHACRRSVLGVLPTDVGRGVDADQVYISRLAPVRMWRQCERLGEGLRRSGSAP
jgi:hypothetical protein